VASAYLLTFPPEVDYSGRMQVEFDCEIPANSSNTIGHLISCRV